jgi:hypothetical protein
MKAIEITGKIDNKGILTIDRPLKLHNKQVKIIILIPEEEDEMDDALWLQAVSSNPAFDFLEEEEEDIYTIEDGEPITNKA